MSMFFKMKSKRVHLHLGREVIDGAHGDDRCLWMIGRAPGASAALVGGDGSVLLALVGNLEDVGQRRSSATAHAARSPRARFPGDQLAVFVGGDFDARVSRRTHARDFELGFAVEHVLHRLAARFFRQVAGVDVPAIDGKLAAKTAANVLLQDVDVAGGNAERLSQLGRNAGNVLRGNVNHHFFFGRAIRWPSRAFRDKRARCRERHTRLPRSQPLT